MEQVVLSNKIKDFEISLARRTSDFKMDQFHYHPYYEIYFSVSGSCTAFINHSIYHIVPGDFVLIPQSAMHRFVYNANSLVERYNLHFTTDYIDSLFGTEAAFLLQILFQYPVLHLTSQIQMQAHSLLDALYCETEEKNSFSEADSRAYAILILSLLARNRDRIQLQDLNLMENAIQTSARYIFNHFRENLSLSDVAAAVHMSPTYYSKKFKSITGIGFKEYLTKIRLYEATELLVHSDLNITEIALCCGFNDGNYFGDAFRKEYGMSPLKYKRECKALPLHFLEEE